MADAENMFQDTSDSEASFEGFHESDLDESLVNPSGNNVEDSDSDIDVSESDSDEESNPALSSSEDDTADSENERFVRKFYQIVFFKNLQN